MRKRSDGPAGENNWGESCVCVCMCVCVCVCVCVYGWGSGKRGKMVNTVEERGEVRGWVWVGGVWVRCVGVWVGWGVEVGACWGFGGGGGPWRWR